MPRQSKPHLKSPPAWARFRSTSAAVVSILMLSRSSSDCSHHHQTTVHGPPYRRCYDSERKQRKNDGISHPRRMLRSWRLESVYHADSARMA
jgi:hypothetical protein